MNSVNVKQLDRKILHIDGDAFFVGVEQALDPTLKGKMVVTGAERGIVSALSYEAKAAGVTRGMPIAKLRAEFPQAIVKPGNYRAYAEFANKMFLIVRRYTPDVEEYSIDECFADLTGVESLHKKSAGEIAAEIQKVILSELDISVTVGVAPTKTLAKVASKWVKPAGCTVIEPSEIMAFLDKMPVEKIWGIGHRTAKKLTSSRVMTAGDFVRRGEAWVARYYSRPYVVMWYELTGTKILPLVYAKKESYKSISVTRTFERRTDDFELLMSYLMVNLEHACLKSRRYGLLPRRVGFFLKTKDFQFISGTVNLALPSTIPGQIMPQIRAHLDEVFNPHTHYRTTGVYLLDLMPENREQFDLFGAAQQRIGRSRALFAMDTIGRKYGTHTVFLASSMQAHERVRPHEGATLDRKKGARVEAVDFQAPFLSML